MVFRSTAHIYDRIYELVGKDYVSEAADLVDLVRERNPQARTLLDVACGTGAHLVHLRDRFEVAGVDLDPGMLEEAARKLPGVTLVQGDMASFDLGARFDVVTCLFSSIGYLATAEELDRAVANMAAHLTPGGVLVIDGWIRPDAWDDRRAVHALCGERDGVAVSRVSRSAREGRWVVLHMHHLVATAESVDHLVDTHRLTFFTDEEYRRALAAAGLDVAVVDSPMPDRDRYVAVRP